MSTKRLATDAMFLTLALVVSYIEVLIPVPVGIPGVKLGLANGVIMVLLFKDRSAEPTRFRRDRHRAGTKQRCGKKD